MAEWGAAGVRNPRPQNKMLLIRESPRTAHVFPRTSCPKKRCKICPSRALRASHTRNYECVAESFSPFANFGPEFLQKDVRNGKRPSGFRKISPQNNFPGRPLSRPLESATPIVDGHGK